MDDTKDLDMDDLRIETGETVENSIVETVDNPFDAPETEHEESVESMENKVNKGLRKLNPKYKTKAEREAERAALSEMEQEGYVPEEHEPEYEVKVDRSIYANNYLMSAVLILFGVILFPYSKTATGLLVFYGLGVAWMAYKGLKLRINVDGTNFTITGAGKGDGTYTFDDVDKIIYVYNKKDQRRYWIHVGGKRICEVPPGAIHSRWLYDDMIGYGVPGGWYNKL